MSLLRNLADDLELMDWLQNRVWPMEEKMGPGDVYAGALLSMVEMIRSGVTAFADMYFSMEEVAKAAGEAGIRANTATGLTGDRVSSRDKLLAFRDFHSACNGSSGGLITVDLGPHAPYTCDDGCLEAAAQTAEDLGCGIHIHLSETAGEVVECRERYGLSPIQLADRSGLFSRRTIAAHCVHVDENDMDILAARGVHVVHNPTSNLKLASGFAPVDAMLKKGVKLAIGTDGPASNNNQNMFEELHLAAILAKAVSGDPTAMPAAKALSLATLGGASALGLPDGCGILEKGSPADFIILKTTGAHMQPLHDPAAALVYSASASDVDTVICNGRVIMCGGIIETIDEERVIALAGEAAGRLASH
jgi:5-methylthioadenosine/S-adenosylhomocysteine deaminase